MKIFLSLFFLLFNELNALEIKDLFESFYNKEGLRSSIWGIKISYVDGENIFSFNEDKNLIPASILKIFVTAASLDVLGPDARFRTILAYRGKIRNSILEGDILIKGEGDMTLGSENFGFTPESVFQKWLAALNKKGIKALKGNIIVDDSILNEIQPGSWSWEDIGNYYAAPFSALSINDNSYKIFFKTGQKKGDKTKVLKIEPKFSLKILNEVLTGENQSGDNAYIYGLPWSREVIVSGTLPPQKESFFIKGSIGESALFCGELFKNYLAKNNFKVYGNIIKNKLNDKDVTILNQIWSPAVSEIIKVTNKKSFNFYAEMLLRFLTYKNSGKAGKEYGLNELYRFLSRANVNVKDIYIEDASGLSRNNCVKPSDFIKVLNYVYGKEYFQFFYDSFVYPGDSLARGHVRNIGLNKSFSMNLRIKTGSLKKVRAYTGYISGKKGRLISFCSIINDYSINPKILDYLHNELFSALYENY